jgi:hypothetical protein
MIRHCCCCQWGQVVFKKDGGPKTCAECRTLGGYPHFERRHDPVTDHEAALEWLLHEVSEIRTDLRQLKAKYR